MDKSPSETLSPTTGATNSATSNRRNPFSIDYILSSSAAAVAAAASVSQADNKKHQERAEKEMNLMSQQRAQLMAAAAAIQAQQTASLDSSSQQSIKLNGPQHSPSFLYFMACMLLQQQQQQQQQQLTRQPIDLARSPMDSLAILARLGGQQETNHRGKQNGSRPLPATSSQPTIHRHQPYQIQQATRTNYALPINAAPLEQLISLRHQQNQQQQQQQQQQLNRAPQLTNTLDLFNQQRLNQRTVSQSQKLGQVGKFSSILSGNNGSSSGCSSTNIHGDKLDNLKPAHSYIGLIAMCILSTPEKRMVLNDIYQFILDNYPYYRNRGSGWRNSVRHNLSLNECFQKAGRAANGKGHYWTIHAANMEDFMLGDFRRRRAQRKVRRWNNMDVPSDESEDESMEDATKPALPEHFKRSLEMHRRLEMSYQKSAVEQAALLANLTANNNQASGLFRKQTSEDIL